MGKTQDGGGVANPDPIAEQYERRIRLYGNTPGDSKIIACI